MAGAANDPAGVQSDHPLKALKCSREVGMEAKPTILITIVDDDRSVREALTGLIRSLGYRAVAFERAEDLLRSGGPDCIACLIADVQMPSMSGVQLYQALVVAGRHVPTILITAYPDEPMRERAKQAGVACYLAKPFSEDELLGCLRSILGDGEDEDHATPPP